jgi:hypothetical protein
MRALNEAGREKFATWIRELSSAESGDPPQTILEDNRFSFTIPGTGEIQWNVFESKFEMAQYLMPFIEAAERQNLSAENWAGIYDALSLLFFDSLCSRNKDGSWVVKMPYFYVYDSSYRVRHRHRIYGPITLYRNGGDAIKPFLGSSPDILGDFEEQIGSNNELAGNPNVLRVLNSLYVSQATGKTIPGYTSRKKFEGFQKELPIPGSLRRFTAICKQLSRTYDLAGVSLEGFVSLLPKEFSDWLEK